MEKTVEIKSCKNCGTQFEITDKDLEFYNKISPRIGDKKYSIPTPTFCPECRLQRRLSWCNERKLYHRKSDLNGKQLISIYSPDKNLKVYSYDEWWSDQWDPLDYGKSFDFNRSFFEQFRSLLENVPLLALLGANNENSDFVNLTVDSKNCYLVTESSNNEDSFYGYWLQKCNNVCDVSFSHECEHSYEIQDCYYCYNLMHSTNCINTSNSWFMDSCEGCSYCFGCVNLVNKSYNIFNKEVSKEEFQQFMQEYFQNITKNFGVHYQQWKNLSLQYPKKFTNTREINNSSGDYMKNTDNCHSCFHAYDAQDCKYSEHVWRNAKDIMDGNVVGRDAFKIYEALNTNMNSNQAAFCAVCWYSHDIYYCFHSFNCSNCFGCIGLNNKEYCILNKQYTKEEYEKLLPQIIQYMQSTGEWGEFFSTTISPFAYNESVAQEYFIMNKEEVGQKGRQWSDYENKNGYSGEYYAPLTIHEYASSEENKAALIKGVLKCEITGRPYRILKQELDFYLKHNISIPLRSPDQRHLDRLARRNPKKLRERECQCDNCAINNNSDKPIVFKTTYSPDRPEKVYCETCYNKEVYG